MVTLQLENLFSAADKLQKVHGAAELMPIYGAGCVDSPRVCFVFMNPTGRNISAHPNWNGLRAPWLGTKNIWKMFYTLGLVSEDLFNQTQNFKPLEWNEHFSYALYTHLHQQRVYLTNLAKCSQLDARPLHNSVFNEYRSETLAEIQQLRPKVIVTFGNQVSSILLQKQIKVSDYSDTTSETLQAGEGTLSIYPVYYPVGQGMRNMPAAISRLQAILRF